MQRITLDNGQFFHPDLARLFEPWTDPAGPPQWEREQLYLTRAGVWILNTWLRVGETHEVIDEARAVIWLVRNKADTSRMPPSAPSHLVEFYRSFDTVAS